MKDANYAPVYAAGIYPKMAEIARSHGYAMAVHGSLDRDFDCICIPWTLHPSDPQLVVNELVKTFAITIGKEDTQQPILKLHGRLTYILNISFGSCYVDLSFMPRLPDGNNQ